MQHWCLVRYFLLEPDRECTTINHWKTELKTFMQTINHELDVFMNYSYKRELLEKVWDEKYNKSNIRSVYNIVSQKFAEEHIPLNNNEYYRMTLEDLKEEKDEIISVIINEDLIDDYVERIDDIYQWCD